MNRFFRRQPLAIKLILIGLIPLLFLIYLTFQIYKEKNEKLKTLESYIQRIHQSANLSSLIDALQTERKISFDYALGKAKYSELYKVRPLTDSLLLKVERSDDPGVHGFKEYTSLDRLHQTRLQIDSSKISPGAVMHHYSNSIFRLNTLNTVPQSVYLKAVYQDMAAQKILSEMSTYLGIIRSNVYNVLITRQYMVETMMGTVGTFDVYKSYEKEFLMKASPEVVQAYGKIKTGTDLKTTREYLDTLFKKFSFDSSFTADKWWSVSNNGLNELSALQQSIWKNVESEIHSIYNNEMKKRDTTLILFVVILLILTTLITYTIITISNMLRKLKMAAQTISKGSTVVNVRPESPDAIGSLASSIAEIAKTNQEHALAAEAIGNGNFKVEVKPLSEEDVLGNALVKMKEALSAYSNKMELLVQQRTEELEHSNNNLQQFAHVASHDLKEPLRKITTFASRLMEDDSNKLTDNSKTHLAKINHAAVRMSKMIDGILNYSFATASKEPFELVDLNTIAENVKTDLELLIEQKGATVQINNLPQIEGAPVLLNQLLYNLLNNALKFSKENIPPVVTIEAGKLQDCSPEDEDACYEIKITDNGIGFDAQYAEEIFGTFNRLHSAHQYEGTGLGLALCKRIIDYHGGKIWAESNDSGATFHIILPQKQERRSLVNN